MVIFDVLKIAAQVLKESGKIEQYKQILEVQKELLEMQNKINELEIENKDLKEKLKIKDNIFFENNAYWIKKENDNKDGPFCTGCWDNNTKLIRLSSTLNKEDFMCPVCKNVVNIIGV